MKISIIALTLMLAACTPSSDKGGTVVCYSGGVKIYDNAAIGKIVTSGQNFYFVDKEFNAIEIVNGSCIINYII